MEYEGLHFIHFHCGKYGHRKEEFIEHLNDVSSVNQINQVTQHQVQLSKNHRVKVGAVEVYLYFK